MALPQQVEPGALLERESELRSLDAALGAARAGEGAIVLLGGPAGIGKTRLVDAARGAAAEAGMAVVTARGSDLEREFQWGVVRQLLEPALAGSPAKRSELLAGAAGLAAPLLSPGEGSAPGAQAGGGEGEGSFLHGLYWLCANLAGRAPLLLAIDDAHWSDLPSLRFLAYLAHRIEGLSMALIVAARPADSPREEEFLERLASEPWGVVLRPAPLSGQAVAGVLGARLAGQPDPRFTAACQTATRGNPFLLEELARSMRNQGLAPDGEAAEMVMNLGPRSVARAITRRVRGLAAGALDLARAVSVLGPDAELRRVAALAGLEPERAAAAADRLVAAEVLAPGRPLDFIHPLARAAIYGDLPVGERSRLHSEAARLLAGEGAATARVAGQLLPTEPAGDGWTVDMLRAAAREAMSDGAPPAAIAYLERALAEPPDTTERGRVLQELGRAEGAHARLEASEDHLRKAIALESAPDARAAILLELARTVSVTDWERGGFVYLEALEALPAEDPLALTLEGELITLALNVYSLADRVQPIVVRRLEQLAAGEIDDPLLVGALGLALALSVPPASHGAAVAERSSDLGLIEYNTNLPGCIGNAFLFAGDLERAAHYYGAVAEEARRRGWINGNAWTNSVRARISLQLGEVRRAEEEARLAFERLEEVGASASAVQRGYFTGHLCEALIERGALDEADGLLSRQLIAEDSATTYGETLVLHARSSLRLAQGRPAEALADALAMPPPGLEDWNPATAPWRSNAALAQAALGHLEEARALAHQELALARAFEVPHAIARALRAGARSAEDLAEAQALLEEGVDTVERTPARLELAHAVVQLGEVLRRAGKRRAAIEQLRRGLDLAHRCGASALADRARDELRLAGARPRRALISGVDALTAAERRVAQLAAEGLTNQVIAQALFVTGRTVEGHLTHAYQKLDISSRRELPDALEVGALDATA